MKKIFLWKGYHQNELLKTISTAWQNNDLVILCPPYLNDVSFFISSLPSGEIIPIGDWNSVPEIKQNTNNCSYPTDPVLGIFTTGTTRETPKLVIYSKENLITTTKGIMSFFDQTFVKTIYCYPQPFHVFGLVLGYVTSMLNNLKLITEDGPCTPFSHQRWLDIDDRTKQTMITLGTPTHFKDLLYYCSKKEIIPSSSYSAIIGGAKVDRQLWQELPNKLNIKSPTIGYGCTEASLGVCHTTPGKVPESDGDLGHIIPGVDAQITEAGLKITGKSVCLSMITDKGVDFPKEILIKDKIILKPDNSLAYMGRHKLHLNHGGEKYSLEQIEEHITQTTGIYAICIPVPDPRLGETLGIVIESNYNENELQAIKIKIYQQLRSKFGKKFPQENCLQINKIPTNSNGKVDRKECKKLLMQSTDGIKLNLPIKTSHLFDYLPHRPPMVWIDEVLSLSSNEEDESYSGTCQTNIRSNPFFFSNSTDFNQTTYLEWMAQGHGYISAARSLLAGKTMAHQQAFLAGFSNFKILNSIHEYSKDRVIIHTKLIRQLGQMSLIEAKVISQDDKIIFAQSNLKLFAK